MLDKSIYWDRMSCGIKWPKMVLTYKDGSIEETDGTTYQCQHGLRSSGKRPIKIRGSFISFILGKSLFLAQGCHLAMVFAQDGVDFALE